MNLIKENTILRYSVVVDNKVLFEDATQTLAEQFISTLTPDVRAKAHIIPVTESGKQILFS